jgi:hypothetical protein
VHAFSRIGSPVPGGGIDGGGDAYPAGQPAAPIRWRGLAFEVGGAHGPAGVSGMTLALPAGRYSSLRLLATGVHGAQLHQTFLVTYRDGTSARFSRSVSDWRRARRFAGESVVATMGERVTATGAADRSPVNVYGYSLPLDPTRPVRSITLPANRDVVMLAATLVP